jgi:hypothetical protein
MSIALRRGLLGGALILAVATIGLPFVGPSTADASTPALTVTVACFSNPERVTIKNNRSATVTIRTVGSLYKPRSNEPFSVSRKLGPGKSVSFYAGGAASSSSANTLTRQYIFNNDISSEGVRVTSSVGTFSRRC